MITQKKALRLFGNIVAVIFMTCIIGFANPIKCVYAADSSANIELFRNELETMLETGDYSVHNISSYKITYAQMKAIYKDLINGKCRLAYTTYGDCFLNPTVSGNYIQTVNIRSSEKNFTKDYAVVTQKVKTIMSGMDTGISDTDKALYLHDALLKSVYYSGSGNDDVYYAKGLFVNGHGVCSGYAEAYKLLLAEAGITSTSVVSAKMDHEWVYVNLNGNWYHVDPTWDDTTATSAGISHEYFLLNDEEAQKETTRKHTDWYFMENNSYASTSTTYSGSFLHDIVGNAYYENGMVYYSDGKSIKSNTDDGKNEMILYTGDENVSISSVENGIVSYKCNGVTEVCSANMIAETKAVVPGINASFYLVKAGGSRTDYRSSNYYSLGDGTIKEAVRTEGNTASVEANLLAIPDLTKYVDATQKVEWYSIKQQSDGWHVDGQIIDTASKVNDSDVTKVTASFFLVKAGGSRTNYNKSNYYSLGKGTIKKAIKIQGDSSSIIADLDTVPDSSNYVKDNQHIEWYSIKQQSDGWHVDGQIIDDSVSEISLDENSDMQGAEARFYLVKEGGSRTDYSSCNYYSLGIGSIKMATAVQGSNDIVSAALGEIPDTSQYIDDTHHIEWYSIKHESDGWHVDGQIVSNNTEKTNEEANVAESKSDEALTDNSATIAVSNMETMQTENENAVSATASTAADLAGTLSENADAESD